MEAKKLFSRVGFGYVLFFMLSAAAQYLELLILMGLSACGITVVVDANLAMLLSQVAMYGCAFPVFYLYMKRIPSWGRAETQKLSIKHIVMLILFCFGVTYLGNMMGQLLMSITARLTGVSADNPVDFMVDQLHPLALLFYVVIVAPLMEEVVFRKLLIDRIIPYGQKTAVIISGVAFGLFHGNFYQFFYACFMGMIFAYIYSRTGTIWYGVFFHAIINFMGGFVTSFLIKGMNQELVLAQAGMMFLGIFMIATIIAAIIMALIYASRIKFYKGWLKPSEGGIFKTLTRAPGIWAYLIACMVMFFVS